MLFGRFISASADGLASNFRWGEQLWGGRPHAMPSCDTGRTQRFGGLDGTL
jgi:hypothetical protein